jgi:Na+-transporting NADH:ubiquinone oxidoreductase subunit NqrC
MMIKILAIMGIIMSVMTAGFYWYYKNSQATIAALNQDKGTLSVAVNLQEQTIASLENNYKLANEQLTITNQALSEARQQNRQLVDRLGKHEIGALAEAKPVLIERIINNATSQANRCFELLTGAELNEREKNATNPRAFNSECPWLYNP